MYKCEKCGEVYSVLPSHNEYYPYQNGCVPCVVEDWICECGGEIGEACECDFCEKYYFSNELLSFDRNGEYMSICDNCISDLKDRFEYVIYGSFNKKETAALNEIVEVIK